MPPIWPCLWNTRVPWQAGLRVGGNQCPICRNVITLCDRQDGVERGPTDRAIFCAQNWAMIILQRLHMLLESSGQPRCGTRARLIARVLSGKSLRVCQSKTIVSQAAGQRLRRMNRTLPLEHFRQQLFNPGQNLSAGVIVLPGGGILRCRNAPKLAPTGSGTRPPAAAKF